MPSSNVDLVLVLDSSKSMTPTFQGLREHLDALLKPLQQAAFDVRIGVVVEAASNTKAGIKHLVTFVGGKGLPAMRAIYGRQPGVDKVCFTSEPRAVRQVLDEVKCGGDEDLLLALDIALDFPWRDVTETRRVVALFTDEAFDQGVTKGFAVRQLDGVLAKLAERRVKLFLAAPSSPALDALACADGVEWETVDGGTGLSDINFAKLLAQMAKTISVASLQAAGDDTPRPLYGQDRWTESDMADGFQ